MTPVDPQTRQERDASILRDAFFAVLGIGAAVAFGYLLGKIVHEGIPRLPLPTINIVVTRPVPDYMPDEAA